MARFRRQARSISPPALGRDTPGRRTNQESSGSLPGARGSPWDRIRLPGWRRSRPRIQREGSPCGGGPRRRCSRADPLERRSRSVPGARILDWSSGSVPAIRVKGSGCFRMVEHVVSWSLDRLRQNGASGPMRLAMTSCGRMIPLCRFMAERSSTGGSQGASACMEFRAYSRRDPPIRWSAAGFDGLSQPRTSTDDGESRERGHEALGLGPELHVQAR